MRPQCEKCAGLLVIDRELDYQINALLFIQRCLNCGRRIMLGRTPIVSSGRRNAEG